MRILLTGVDGFVGSHIKERLEPQHEIVGLEAHGTFREWYDAMDELMKTDIDAIIHAGAISNNQTNDPDIYLWNSYATFLLAKRARQKMSSLIPIPFIYFSTLLVEETQKRWDWRSPYTWSKVQGETFVHAYQPHATILRPCVIWGDESGKHSSSGSVPYQLAAHKLEFLFRKWARRYVHVSDVVKAVENCLKYKHQGTYAVTTDVFWTNKELAKLVQWEGYEWINDPREVGFLHILYHKESLKAPKVPGWKPTIDIKTALPSLERTLNDANRALPTDRISDRC